MFSFGKKKKATAVAVCKPGNGLIKVNGRPLDLVQPEILRFKLYEPLLILGKERYVFFKIVIFIQLIMIC